MLFELVFLGVWCRDWDVGVLWLLLVLLFLFCSPRFGGGRWEWQEALDAADVVAQSRCFKQHLRL